MATLRAILRARRALVLTAAVLLWPAFPSVPQEAPAGLPEGVSPLPPGLGRRLQELLAETETLRGLKAKRAVASGIVEERDLPARIAQALREELPPERLQAAEAGLKAFGLIPESLDLAGYLPALLASEVAGYYDPERHYLAVVRRGGEARRLDELVLVHELAHALQDQTFDLQRFVADDPLSDAATARTALVEGDASLVMFDWLAGQAAGPAPGLPASKEMAAAPPWVRATLELGYVDGYLFCLSVRQKGGQKLLDYTFSQDPPRSSEQILHPEKWHTRRDDPVPLSWPGLGRELPGARKLAEGQLGELGIGVLLREATGDRELAEAAAAGWGGDRFAVYEKDGRRLLAWLTEWDTEADARELREAARRLGKDWAVEPAERRWPRRVVVLRGPWRPAEARAVRAALAAVRAGRPDNRAPDLAGPASQSSSSEATPAGW